VTARLKGRRREVDRLLIDLVAWAAQRPTVDALVLVGSYARGGERMASDVDVVVLTADPGTDSALDWFAGLRPGSRLVRRATWGPVREQRHRLRSGLLVELGVAPTSWAAVPLDAGTRRVLADGHRVLHDPHGFAAAAGAAAGPLPSRPPFQLPGDDAPEPRATMGP